MDLLRVQAQIANWPSLICYVLFRKSRKNNIYFFKVWIFTHFSTKNYHLIDVHWFNQVIHLMFNWRSQCLQIDIVKRRLVFLSRYQISVTGENAASKTECPSEARRWPKTGSKLEDGGAFTATTGWDKSRILISVRWWRWQLCQRRRSGTFMLTLEPGSSMTLLF